MAEATVDSQVPAKLGADAPKKPLLGLTFLENLADMPVLRQVGLLVGLAASIAIGFGMVIGPSQVVGRLLEFTLGRRAHPLWTARTGSALLLAGIGVLLLVAGGPALVLAMILYGGGNGILTIARGTLPMALFGPAGNVVQAEAHRPEEGFGLFEAGGLGLGEDAAVDEGGDLFCNSPRQLPAFLVASLVDFTVFGPGAACRITGVVPTQILSSTI